MKPFVVKEKETKQFFLVFDEIAGYYLLTNMLTGEMGKLQAFLLVNHFIFVRFFNDGEENENFGDTIQKAI
jgi:hypothetical protein